MTNAVNIAQSGANNVTMRNRIINGGMVFDQRNAGASVTPAADGYTLDRWSLACSNYGAGVFTVQQNAGSVTPPAGFANYFGITSTGTTSASTGNYAQLIQNIEGYNTADLAWGTASAATITISFWVRSSLTGTFGGSVRNSADNRAYIFSYTINSANTWEQKTITVTGDTTGTWLTTNGRGVVVRFAFMMGSSYVSTPGSWTTGGTFAPTGQVNVLGTNGATFYITGVQLEKGTAATAFEQRLYGTELALCQRYFSRGVINAMWGAFESTTSLLTVTRFPVTMRASPTVSRTGLTQAVSIAGTISDNGGWNYTGSNVNGAAIAYAPSSGTYTLGLPAQIITDTVTFSAEL